MANIGKYLEEASRFFKSVARALDTPSDIEHAHRVTSAVLHSIRERISVDESMHLISNLPMILRGIYVDGWKLSRTSFKSDSLEDFLQLVREHASALPGRDCGNNKVTENHVRAVLHVMKRYVPEGEYKDIRCQLPKAVANLFE
jgi:uncharacterized protein (DUF2267 family)